MKHKILLFGVLSILSIALVWCNPEGNIITNEYPFAEQICIDNDWEITTDSDWNPICLLYADEYCYLEDMEDWWCDLLWYMWDAPLSVYCEESWWTPEYWMEWWEDFYVCAFEDDSFCYLDDLFNWYCNKWDMFYWGDAISSYAKLECLDSNGQLSENDLWDEICIFSDDDFCYIGDILNWSCEFVEIYEYEDESEYQKYLEECYLQGQWVVCGEDWNTYYNRCFMDMAWVEEETELAEVVDWECIYW